MSYYGETLPALAIDIEAKVREYQLKVEKIKRLCEEVREVQEIHGLQWAHSDRWTGSVRPEDVEKRLGSCYWRELLNQTEVMNIISAAKSAEIRNQIEANDLPPYTVDNINAWVKMIYETMPDMIAETIKEVYAFLRPYRPDRWGGEYKTNEKNGKYELGKKVILSYAADTWSGVTSHTQHMFKNMHNVFSILDKKGQVHYPKDFGTLCNSQRGTNWTAENEYFKATGHKNRNIHLEFKRADLLEKFNAIAGGKNLKDTAAA